MRILHLKEGVVTEEECEKIKNEYFWYIPDIQALDLTLVLLRKSGKQHKAAIKTLEGYPSQLTNLTLRYLTGKHIDIYYSGYTINHIVLHLVYCPDEYCVTQHDGG